MVLILVETAAGFAIFKVNDPKSVETAEGVRSAFSNPESASRAVRRQAFSKFENTTDALSSATALVNSTLSDGLKAFLKKSIVKKNLREPLAVIDKKLVGVINKAKIGVECIYNKAFRELHRGIRCQLESLMADVAPSQMKQMSLGLSHTIARYKLKFSPDKVDNMIVQAIALLDDLDKELNTYSMRVKEWYGWHFPEMVKVINDNYQYAKCVLKMGVRAKCADCDFSDILAEDVEKDLKTNAVISAGTEISEEDVLNISMLCTRVLSLATYRSELSEYLQNRMRAIAPNVTALVGDLVGARLIAHAGSLMTLAKYPASTVQILGAEKALFRALKSKKDTPKFGLLYHASLIGSVGPKNKGKVARALAAKCSLSARVDALGEKDSSIGEDSRERLLKRIAALENGMGRGISGSARRLSAPGQKPSTPKTGSYNAASDTTIQRSSHRVAASPATPAATPAAGTKRARGDAEDEKSEKKKKKHKSTAQKDEKSEKKKKQKPHAQKDEKKKKKSTAQAGKDEGKKKRKQATEDGEKKKKKSKSVQAKKARRE